MLPECDSAGFAVADRVCVGFDRRPPLSAVQQNANKVERRLWLESVCRYSGRQSARRQPRDHEQTRQVTRADHAVKQCRGHGRCWPRLLVKDVYIVHLVFFQLFCRRHSSASRRLQGTGITTRSQ